MRIPARMTLTIVALVLASACHGPVAPPPPSPSITSVSPGQVVAGSPDLRVTVHGTNFVNASGISSVVKWVANGISTALATTFVRETELNAVIPAALLQRAVTAQLLVRNVEISSGTETSQESNPLSFAVVAKLGITSISPTSAVAGSPDLTVTVTGGGFFRSTVCHCFTSSFLTWVENGEETVLSTAFVSEKELTAIIPAALLKNVVAAQLYVRNADITESDAYTKSNPVNFTVLPPAIAR